VLVYYLPMLLLPSELTNLVTAIGVSG